MARSFPLGAVTWLVVAAVLQGQNTGRFANQSRIGLELVEKGKFREAINVLDEIWEQDQSDPAIAENLGLCYLYAEADATSAAKYMAQAIALGGRASFLMQHAHEKLGKLSGGEISDYCTGRLSIYRDHLVFTASVAAHSFVVRAGELLEIKTNRVFGRSTAAYHIRTLDKKTYNLRPKTWLDVETSLFLKMVDEYISTKR